MNQTKIASFILLLAQAVAAQTVTTNLPAQADVDIRSGSSPSPDTGYNRDVLRVSNQSADPTAAADAKAYIRFQLPADFGAATSATLTLTRTTVGAFGWTYTVYGLNEGPIPGSTWNELTWPEVNGGNSSTATTWNNAPGNVPGSASDFSDCQTLGAFTTKNAANGGMAGDQYSISGPALAAFLNADSNGFVTIMISRTGLSSSLDLWASKENSTWAGPQLSLTYSPNTNLITADLKTLASQRWNAWRRNRHSYFTAAWQALYIYAGTASEYQTYHEAELNSVQSPFSQFEVANSAGLDIIMGSWEGVYSNQALLAYYTTYPSVDSTSVTGYLLKEEPQATDFPQLAQSTAYIYRHDQRNAIPIVVHLPNWAVNYDRFGLGKADGTYYATYINKYVRDVSPCVMVNDNYPIYANDAESTNFYPNIEYFRSIAVTNDIGLMGFALVTAHTNGNLIYRQPSESDLNWMVYSYLAYGADGIFYYNYRYPQTNDYGEGLVTDAGGIPRQTYYMVRGVNQELNNLWSVFQHLKSVDVFHTGPSVPAGTEPFVAGGSAAITAFTGSNFIIGDFTNADDPTDDNLYAILVNKRHGAASWSSNLTAIATFSACSNRPNVSLIDPMSGNETSLTASAGQYTVAVGGGKGILLKFSPETAYERWTEGCGLSGPEAALSADPDHDGVNNLYEYAFDGDPTNQNVIGMAPLCRAVAESGTNWLEYVYPRRLESSSGLTYELELSEDMLSWTNSGYVQIGAGQLNSQFEAVTNRVQIEDGTKRFLRVRVNYSHP